MFASLSIKVSTLGNILKSLISSLLVSINVEDDNL